MASQCVKSLDHHKMVNTYLTAIIWPNNRTIPLEFYLIAVKMNGYILYYIDLQHQTREICIAAIQQNYRAVRFVQRKELCTEMWAFSLVSQSGLNLEQLWDQSHELCITAVRQNGMALKFVKEPSVEICSEAMRQNNKAYQFVAEGMRNKMATMQITDICLGLHAMYLPSYVLLEIIDYTLNDCTLTHWAKIHQVIKINEKKRLLLSKKLNTD